MKKISNWALVLTAALALVYVNLNAWQSQQIKLRGEILFLELAPVDPLSLVQGQYMRLRFGIEKRYDTTQEDYQIIQNNRGNGLAIINLDSRRIGTLTGLLAPNQWRQQRNRDDTVLLQIHAQSVALPRVLTPFGTHSIRIKQNSFLFQENTEDRYAQAKYGMFRVRENGLYILVDLADEDLRPLTPQP
jgi:uncharacterized membrane-anchored protein